MVIKHVKIYKLAIINVALLVFALGYGKLSNASDVYILAKDNGQGISLSKGDLCYIVTAQHVIEDAGDITLIAPDRTRTQATPFYNFGNEIDIAVLRVSGNSSQICKGNKWTKIYDLSQKLEDAHLKGNLKLRKQDGSRRSMRVEIIRYKEDRYIFIRPVSTKDVIAKGMSGGLLVVNGINAGILTQVNPNKGEGTVVRQDFLYDLLRKLLEEHRSIGKVEKLAGQSVIIKLYTKVPVGKKLYVLTPSGRKIMLKVVKVHLDYASAKYQIEDYTPKKGDAIYEYN